MFFLYRLYTTKIRNKVVAMSHVTIQLHELVVIDKTNVLVYNWDAWEATLAEDAIASFERLNLKDLPRLPGAAASASSTMQSQETSEKHGDTCYKIGEYELAKKHYDAVCITFRINEVVRVDLCWRHRPAKPLSAFKSICQ